LSLTPEDFAKDFNLEEFYQALEQSYAHGYRRVKLYFMIGLPTETPEDLEGIIDFALSVSDLRKKTNAPVLYRAQVNISINTLIPKPHTDFERLGMENLDAIQRKQNYLKQRVLRHKRLKLNFHDAEMSILEGVLCRGDRRLSQVILNAYLHGAKFDSWSNHFNFEKWILAFEESGLSLEFYLGAKGTQETLPWDFIDTGVSKEALSAEFNKVSEAITYGGV